MTPSQLSIIVKSQGVEKAAQDLDKLAKAAASVDSETKAFVIAQSKLAESNQKVSKSSEATARGISVQELAMVKAHEAALAMNVVISKAAKSQEELTNAMGKSSRGVSAQELAMIKAHEQALQMNVAFDKQADSLKNVSHHGNIFNNTLKSMAVAASAYIGINFAAGIFKSADAWASMQSKLALATGSMNAAKVVQEDLYKVSQNIRIPLEDTAKLYNRMVHPLMMMGKSSKDTTDMVSSMGYALKLSGATGQEAASAMLQFSQSMNAGRLNGGEFNSIAEASPNILRAVEKELVRTGMGAELTAKGLKKMASEGQLTAKLVSEAMLRALPQWKKDFESLPLTVDGAIVRIKNMWEKSIGTLAQDTGFAQNFTKVLNELETIIPAFAKLVVGALSTAIEYSGLFLKSLTAIAAVGLANWAYTAFMSVQGLSVGMKAATLSTNALAGSMALLQSSMMWFAGAAIGIGLIVKGYQELNKERSGLGAVTTTLEDSHKKYINGLEAETSMLIKQVNLMREKRGESSRLIDPYEKSSSVQSEEKLNDLLKQKLDVQKKLTDTEKEIANLQKAVGTGSEATELARINRLTKLQAIVKESKDSLVRVNTLELEANGKKAFADFAANKATREAAIARTKEAENRLNQLTQYKEKAIEVFNQTKKYADEELAAGNISKQFYDEKIKAAEKLRDTNSKEGKAATRALTEEQEAIKKLKEELAALSREKAVILALGKDADKLLPQEKELIALRTNGASKERVAIQEKIVAEALSKKAIQDKFKAQLDADDAAEKSAKAAKDELQTVEDQIAAFGKIKGSIQESEIARLNEQLTIAKGVKGNEAVIKALEEEITTREKLKLKTGELAGLKESAKADKDNEKLLADMWDTSKIDKFESASTKALKGVAKGFADVSKALDKYRASQSTINNLTKANDERFKNKKIDEMEYLANKSEIERTSANYQISAYANMADAAKNFFQEGTKGYQAMDAVSKVMHAAQMVRSLQAAASGVMAGAAQMFGQSGWGGFAGVAAMGAVMAGLGFATGAFGSSGGGGAKAADVQKTQGAGTVFGDTEAKSESIKKSLDLLKSSYDKLYPVNQGMLKALKNIESSMTGLSNLVLRSGGVIEGTNMGVKIGQIAPQQSSLDSISSKATKSLVNTMLPFVGGALNKLVDSFFGKTSSKIVDSGIQLGGKLSDLQQGKGANQYASVDTTTSKYFGLSKNISNSVQTQGLSDELNSQFAMIFTNMQKSLEEAGKVLYGSSKGVTDALDSLVLSTSKISLKGLTGQALTDAINAVISKGLDEMAAAAFKSFDKFRQVGEGYAQTVIRVANNFATVNAVFDKLGMKMYETSDAGIAASMAFTGLFDSLENMQSVASEYYDKFYTEAEKQNKITEVLKKQFAEMNLVLPDSAKAYRELVDNTSDPAKIAMLWKLSGAFSEVFGTIEQGAKEIPQAMKDAFDSLSKDAQRWLSIRNQAAALKDEINVAMGNPKKDPAIRMQQLWDAMSKDVTPEQKLQLAGELKDLMLQKYQVEKDSLTRLIDFGKQLRNYVDSLKVGSLSPLTVGQKLAEAQAQYQSTFAKAQGGDVAAQGMLQGKADTYLQLAQTALASSGGYTDIFNEVTNGLDSLGIESMSAAEQANQTATEQLAELQRLSDFVSTVEVTANNYYNSSLTALANQITLMDAMYQKMGIFDGMLSSIAGLPAEIAAALSGKVGNSFGNDEFIRNLYQSVEGRVGSQIDAAGYNYWMKDLMTSTKEQVASNFVIASQENNVNRTSSSTSALETQVAALTAEVKGLREDANLQTGAIITAQVMSTETSTTAIVTATKESAVNESWQNSLKPELV